MRVKKIYLIRHGQTDYNLKGIVQGSGVDSSLNDTGRKQAAQFFQYYNHVRFDHIYISELKRTQESVQSFINNEVPFTKVKELNEICWGAQEGKSITTQEDNYYHWMLKQWQMGNTAERILGGESPEDLQIRQQKAMTYIMSKKEEENILICMHGRAIRILLCQLMNYPLKSMDMFEHRNLCLYQLDFTGTMFVIKKHNDSRHLT